MQALPCHASRLMILSRPFGLPRTDALCRPHIPAVRHVTLCAMTKHLWHCQGTLQCGTQHLTPGLQLQVRAVRPLANGVRKSQRLQAAPEALSTLTPSTAPPTGRRDFGLPDALRSRAGAAGTPLEVTG